MLKFDTLCSARDAIRVKKVSARELVREALDRIQKIQSPYTTQSRLD